MNPSAERVVVCRLGRVPYVPAWTLQRQLQSRLVAAKRAEPPERIDDVMLLGEHPPVFTLGKSGDAGHLLASQDELAARGATFHHIDRGGDITFHGPGQLVGYPILDLDRLSPDIHRYLRNLEETIIRTCADDGFVTGRVEGRTGVWLPADGRGPARKICAMGIRCSRWVTMHGFAFNVNTDLSYFTHIVPCGITDGAVTSLARETGAAVDETAVAARVVRHFGEVFQVETIWHEGEDARSFLEAYLGEELDPALPGAARSGAGLA